MNRSKAMWVAVAAALMLAAGYLLMMRRRSASAPAPAAVPFTAARPVTPPAPPLEVVAAEAETSELAAVVEEQPTAEPMPPRAADQVEAPLPGWARAAIIVAALLAFFAVSLIATKHV